MQKLTLNRTMFKRHLFKSGIRDDLCLINGDELIHSNSFGFFVFYNGDL